jgi:hypothetical protein
MTHEANEKQEEEEPKPIFVKVSKDTRNIIDSYKDQGKIIYSVIEEAINLYDKYSNIPADVAAILEKYEDNFGGEWEFIEEALREYDRKKNPEKSEDLDLWCRAREELQMMLIGKTTFSQMLTAAETPEMSLEKPMKRNIALDVILWYVGKPVKNLTLEEILYAIKKMWIVANYFYYVDIREEEKDKFYILFKHHQNKRYSNYWLGYFKELFTSDDLNFKCDVDGQAFDESLSLIVQKI